MRQSGDLHCSGYFRPDFLGDLTDIVNLESRNHGVQAAS